uniref:Uncharacterized protein n=1 Tax=Oryza glaberrima TaxID=4538 RepID=I1NQ89_ORYGL
MAKLVRGLYFDEIPLSSIFMDQIAPHLLPSSSQLLFLLSLSIPRANRVQQISESPTHHDERRRRRGGGGSSSTWRRTRSCSSCRRTPSGRCPSRPPVPRSTPPPQ